MLAVSKPSSLLFAFLCTALLTLAIPTGSALAKQPHGHEHAKPSHHAKYAKRSHHGKRARLFHRARHNQHEVCQDLKGGTRGLYGLCVAYCEAKSRGTDDTVSGRSGRRLSTERLLENYNRRMAMGDPAMPCLDLEEPAAVSPCPCLTEAEASDTQWDSCVVEDGQTRVSGIQGELLSIDTVSATCELTGLYFGADDRYSVLDEQQTSACNNMIEMATEFDGISCENAGEEEDPGLF